MKTTAIIGTISLLTGLATANVSTTDTNIELQTLSVPEYSVSFDRGSYEIIEMSYTPKTQLSSKQLTEILKQAGFSGNGLKMAKAIAFYESTNRPMALNKSSNCYGLFQINMSGSMGPDRIEKYGLDSNEDLFNPLINAQIAYKMSRGGSNWSAWSTNDAAKRSIN
jgi:soluble lytic murein transglycosylase-like protein